MPINPAMSADVSRLSIRGVAARTPQP
jgi:hypothetical protein